MLLVNDPVAECEGCAAMLGVELSELDEEADEEGEPVEVSVGVGAAERVVDSVEGAEAVSEDVEVVVAVTERVAVDVRVRVRELDGVLCAVTVTVLLSDADVEADAEDEAVAELVELGVLVRVLLGVIELVRVDVSVPEFVAMADSDGTVPVCDGVPEFETLALELLVVDAVDVRVLLFVAAFDLLIVRVELGDEVLERDDVGVTDGLRVLDGVTAGVRVFVAVPDDVDVTVEVTVAFCVRVIVGLGETWVGEDDAVCLEGVDVGVGSGVGEIQPMNCGGSATPRNTVPVGAVVISVNVELPVSYEYRQVRVVA